MGHDITQELDFAYASAKRRFIQVVSKMISRNEKIVSVCRKVHT